LNPLVAPEGSLSDRRTALSVNVNKVASLRNTRALDIPSVVRMATIALDAGAAGITVHPRPDERHIRAGDVRDLAALLRERPGAEYNIEGNPFHNLMDFVREVRPHQCTFVPDAMDQSTSDHGWDLAADGARLAPLIDEARALGVRVSLFMDPVIEPMQRAAELGVDRIELYTEGYARAWGTPRHDATLATFIAAADAARGAGLGINAGHDLNRDNLVDFAAAVPGLAEVSIGHALVADALEMGFAGAVEAYLACLDRAQALARR
jgi:pyridoxine 5-phosphate synthase